MASEATAESKTSTGKTPPYLPFKTFTNSLETLSPMVPPRVHRTLWKQPGSIQSQIMATYRFFGLVNELDEPTTALRELVENRYTPGACLKPLIEQKYAGVIQKHDLASMTLPMLQDLFTKAYGIDAEVRKKAIRFFLQAAKAAGIPLSKFLSDQTRGPLTRKRKTRSIPRTENEVREDNGLPPIQGTGPTRSIHLDNGVILTLSTNLDTFRMSKADREFVMGLLDQIEEYEGIQQDSAENADVEEIE